MRWRLLVAVLTASILFLSVRLVDRSQADRYRSSFTASGFQNTWTVENRCRLIFLPLILKGDNGAPASSRFAPAPLAQRSGPGCIQISDADLARIEWHAVAETYARQANRNRQAFGMVPLNARGQ